MLLRNPCSIGSNEIEKRKKKKNKRCIKIILNRSVVRRRNFFFGEIKVALKFISLLFIHSKDVEGYEIAIHFSYGMFHKNYSLPFILPLSFQALYVIHSLFTANRNYSLLSLSRTQKIL